MIFRRVSAGVFALIVLSAVPAQAQTGTALVRHAPILNGIVEGSVQQMTGESVAFNSGGVITADLLVPGTPTVVLNGSPTFGGTIVGTGATTPTNYQIMLKSGARLGRLRTRMDPISLPTVVAAPSPTGTRSVSINTSGQTAGDFTTLRNLTLNSNVGVFMVPAGSTGISRPTAVAVLHSESSAPRRPPCMRSNISRSTAAAS